MKINANDQLDLKGFKKEQTPSWQVQLVWFDNQAYHQVGPYRAVLVQSGKPFNPANLWWVAIPKHVKHISKCRDTRWQHCWLAARVWHFEVPHLRGLEWMVEKDITLVIEAKPITSAFCLQHSDGSICAPSYRAI